MGRNLLTLEGYNTDDQYLGWGISMPSISIPSSISNVMSSITGSVANTTQIVKDQVNAAVQKAQAEAATQLANFKENAKQELQDIKQELQNQFNQEILNAKEMLKTQIKEKWELTKQIKFNELSNEIAKDISLMTLEEYAQERSAALQDKLTQLEADYIKTGFDTIKDKIKTDLKAELKDLLIKGYLKVTGKEIPSVDLAAQTQAALDKINDIIRSEAFSNGVINKVSSTLQYTPAQTTVSFLKIGIGDITNIQDKLVDLTERFPSESVYFILECVNYTAKVLTENGDFIVANKEQDSSALAQTIIDNTVYIPGDNPFQALIEQQEISIPTVETILPDGTVVKSTPAVTPKTDNKKFILIGIAAIAGLYFFMNK